MTVQGINNSAGILTYAAESITIGIGATVTIPNSSLNSFAEDPNVNADLLANNLQLSDTVTTYTGVGAIQFLKDVVASNAESDIINLDQNITGDTQTVTIAPLNKGSIIVEVHGTFIATLNFEATLDGSTWFSIYGQSNSSLSQINLITVPDQVFFSAGGLQSFRVRCHPYTSGIAIVSIAASQSFGGVISYAAASAGGVLPVGVQGGVASTQSGTWNITNVSGTVSLPTGAATSSLQSTGNTSLSSINTNTSGLSLSQAQTTSGQKAILVQGAVTSSAPSYSTTQSDPLSLDTSGNIRATLKDGMDTNYGAASASTLRVAAQLGNQNGIIDYNAGTTGAQTVRVTLANEDIQDLYFTGQAAQTATVNNIIPASSGSAATDLTGYRSGSIQVISTGTGGTFIFEGSNDNSNFQTIPVYSQLILTGTPITAAITATSSNLIYTFPISMRYIRLRIATTITGGNIQAFSKFSQTAWSPPVYQVAQATAGNLNATVTGTITANAGTNLNTSALALDVSVTGLQVSQGSTTSGQKGELQQGAVTTNAPSYSTGQTSPISLDTSGLLRVSLKDTPANSNKLLVTADPITFASAQAVTQSSGPWTQNLTQVGGTNISTGTGAGGAGIPRVTISNDSSLAANQSVNNAQVNGSAVITSVTGIQDVMPRKRTSSTGLSPNYAASHITSKTTTTLTSSTAYISTMIISCSAAGTSWTMVVQNKEGTPKILVPSFTLTVPTTGLPVILQFEEPILMTSGIDIITGGTTAGTVDVFTTYWQ